MFKRNIQFKPYKGMSPWRKVALATWRNSEEASVYGWVDFNSSGIRESMNRFQAAGKSLSPTTIAAKGLAIAIASYPRVNSVIRFGRIYERQDVDIFLQVAPDDSGENLSGMIVRQCDQKSLGEISEEIRAKASSIKSGKKDDFAKITKTLSMSPTFLIGWILRMMKFINYTLNIWSPMLGSPRDAFGSGMVTSLGMMGIQRGLAPLLPFYPCPIIVAVGKLEEKAVAVNGAVEVQEVLPLGITFDHRLVDGVGAAKMFRALSAYIANPS
ncbi:MAG TPA: hypothetical protein EYN38_03825 [Flavobacteriales bacterium]|nr:hypothetical protein [Flavobacteriales bacterium]HIO72216.1 hypothetical protein [Flavobacteriales bacterium]